MAGGPRTCSITIAFNPDARRLESQLAALGGQVDAMVIVDNGSDADKREFLRALARSGDERMELVELPHNHGVGGGLNAGVEAARRLGCDHVVLLDHDSIPAAGMVGALLAAYRDAGGAARVAAVGPRIRDSRDHHEFPFIRLGWTHNPRIRCAGRDGTVDCDFLITSGTLTSLEALERVGPFDDGLFIDFVDLEWCCRARARGLRLLGVCGAWLDHELGEAPRTVMGRLRILVHSPERIYYATRNRMLLYRRSQVPLKWKLKDIPRGVLKVATALLFVAPRATYLRMTVAAMRDGVRGSGGVRPRP